MLICKEYVEKMGYSLNGEMQLSSRKNGRWGIKRGKLRSDREGTAIRNARAYQTIDLCKPCPYGLVWASMGLTAQTRHIPMTLSLDIVCTFPYFGIYGIHFLSILYLSIYCISNLKKWMRKRNLLLRIILNK